MTHDVRQLAGRLARDPGELIRRTTALVAATTSQTAALVGSDPRAAVALELLGCAAGSLDAARTLVATDPAGALVAWGLACDSLGRAAAIAESGRG